ncbi:MULTISPECIES: helix-turn-helix domain-containing protein [Corynebacterium]|uniref:helix-turn-helix domain-containing protein n=1 Tax=Corynebacterium TaxID=1716 RepID=UPI00257F428B|nr:MULTISPECIES: helix-turn-helix domain-containing protein [Corynebacterium]
MGATVLSSEHVLITDDTVREARETHISRGSRVSIRTGTGDTIALTHNVEQMLLQTLDSIAKSGEVTIGRIPEELTSTAAADLLGVSRPTLLKWAREGKIDSFKVRTHTRFRREEVFRLKEERATERSRAFVTLRDSTAANQALFDD